MNFVGVDLGASSTRAVSQTARIGVIDNNIVTLAEDETVRIVPYDAELDSALEVRIRKSGPSTMFPKHVLIGMMAERYSNVNLRPSVQQQKYLQEINYISAITGAATSRILFDTPERITLYLAVPPAELKKAEEAFKKELVGDFEVEFPKYNGGTTVKLSIEDVKCQEESVMSIVSFFFDMNGTARPEAVKYITNGNVLSMNIGASTTDLAVVKNGRYLEKTGKTIPVGGNIARDYLVEKINDEYGFELPYNEADIAMKEGRLRLGNGYEDISKLVSEAKDALAAAIVDRMDPYFKGIGIPLQTLNAIVVSGGGSLRSGYKEGDTMIYTSEPMSSFVTNRIKGWFSQIEVIPYGDEARYADVKGLYIRAQVDAVKEATKEAEKAKGNFQI